MPTPLSPTLKTKTSVLYLAPVFISLTHSTSLPRGIPRPQSRTVTVESAIFTRILLPHPMMNSSTELSTTSFRRM